MLCHAQSSTGGAGFLGSHLCERLLERGPSTSICLDNFFTSQKTQRRAHLLDRPNFEFVQPRRDRADLRSRGRSTIYNLACPAARGTTSTTRIKTLKTSVATGRINVLGLPNAAARKVPAGLDQRSLRRPAQSTRSPNRYRGTVNPIGPRACYDEGKRVAETLFDGLPPHAQGQHSHRADLQHVRPADAPVRWPRGLELHPPGARAAKTFTLFGDGRRRGRSATSTI